MTAPQETPLERVRAVELTLRHHASIVGDPEESEFWTKLADKLTPALEAAPAPVLSSEEREALTEIETHLWNEVGDRDPDPEDYTVRLQQLCHVLAKLLARTKDTGGG